MKIREFEKQIRQPLLQETLLFLIKDDEILLAMKKRGFGVGRFNGVGGKPNNKEGLLETAIRETKEEIGVEPLSFTKVADLKFYFPHKPLWHRHVHTYFCTAWSGKPLESEEMKPRWFKKNELPFNRMWTDDSLWLPHALQGKLVDGAFIFSENEQVLDYRIKFKTSGKNKTCS